MKRPHFYLFRGIPLVVLMLVVALLGIRIALPSIIKSKINDVLASKLPDYVGHVGNVDLSILAGGTKFQDLTLRRRQKEPTHDLLRAEAIEADLSWKALFKGRLLVDVKMVSPQVEIHPDDFPKTKKDTTKGKDWKEVINTIIPFEVESFRIDNGSFTFIKANAEPKVEVKLDQIDAVVADIGNLKKETDEKLPVKFSVISRLQKHSRFAISGKGSFLKDQMAVSALVELQKLELKTLNPVFKEYAHLDISEGLVSVKGSSNVTWPKLDNQFVVTMQGVKVIAPKQKFDGTIGVLAELGTAFGNIAFKDKNEVVDTELNINGAWPNLKVDKWRAVKTLIN